MESCVAYAKAKSTKNQKKGSGVFIIASPPQNDLQTTASSVIMRCVQNVIQQSFLVNKHKRNSDLYICYMNLKICMSICTIRRMKLDETIRQGMEPDARMEHSTTRFGVTRKETNRKIDKIGNRSPK